MVDFIAEVEEELRKDDYNKFLRRYGPIIVGFLIAVVLFTAFVEYRKYAADRTARAASLDYVAADTLLRDGNPDEASGAFLELADVAPDGYAGLSLMRSAIIAGEQGNTAEAVRLYDAASSRFELARHADLAQLKAAYLLANDGQWGDAMLRADPLAEEGAPYEFLARELIASAALKSGNESLARDQYTYLDTIPGVPATVKRRAEQALTVMNTASRSQMTAPTPEAPASETVASENAAPNEEPENDTDE